MKMSNVWLCCCVLFLCCFSFGGCDCNILIQNESSSETAHHREKSTQKDAGNPLDAEPQDLPPFPKQNAVDFKNWSCEKIIKEWPSFIRLRQRCNADRDCGSLALEGCGCKRGGIAINQDYRSETDKYFITLVLKCRHKLYECESDHSDVKSTSCIRGYCIAKYDPYCAPHAP